MYLKFQTLSPADFLLVKETKNEENLWASFQFRFLITRARGCFGIAASSFPKAFFETSIAKPDAIHQSQEEVAWKQNQWTLLVCKLGCTPHLTLVYHFIFLDLSQLFKSTQIMASFFKNSFHLKINNNSNIISLLLKCNIHSIF